MFRAIALVVVCVVVQLRALPTAHAAEQEAVIALAAGAGALAGASGGAAGVGGVDLWIGLDDWLWLDFGAQVGGAEVGAAWGGLSIGLAAALDVLAWVPWIEGRVAVLGDPRPELRPGFEVGVGVDRLLGERWWLGAFGRFTLSTEVSDGPSEAARGGASIVGGIRLALRWEL